MMEHYNPEYDEREYLYGCNCFDLGKPIESLKKK